MSRYRTDVGQDLAQAGIRRQRLAWQLLLLRGYFRLYVS